MIGFDLFRTMDLVVNATHFDPLKTTVQWIVSNQKVLKEHLILSLNNHQLVDCQVWSYCPILKWLCYLIHLHSFSQIQHGRVYWILTNIYTKTQGKLLWFNIIYNRQCELYWYRNELSLNKIRALTNTHDYYKKKKQEIMCW